MEERVFERAARCAGWKAEMVSTDPDLTCLQTAETRNSGGVNGLINAFLFRHLDMIQNLPW